jgi:hypothetical protein
VIHLIIYAIVGAAAGIGALIGASLMRDVQHRVAHWLREHHLARTKLMDAVILLDEVGSVIRASVRVHVQDRSPEVLTIKRTYKVSDIESQELLAELKQRHHAEQNVMSLFTTA